MKTKTLLLIFITLGTLNSFSQKNTSNFKDNVRYGGSFNIGFGTNTIIAISPSAIYDFSDSFSSGISLNYSYYKNKTYDTSTNVYGGSILSLYNVFNKVQLSAELEQLKISNKYSGLNTGSYWNPALYLGASYRNGAMSIGFRYDVLYNENKSLYSSAITPVFRIYF